MFNRQKFEDSFNQAIDAIAGAEQITKRELRALSRTVLEATHETGDIQFVNKLIGVLSPMNRKVAVLFFRAFTGFVYDDALKMFTKKSKKKYDEAHKAYVAFMADPHSNIWTWAEKHVEVKEREFSLDKVTHYMENALQKAKDKNFTNADVLRAVIKAGITADDIIAIMEDVGMEVKVNE